MSRARGRVKGAVAVEFALVVPVLLLIVFAIINFGFLMANQVSMNTAARDAARAGVTQPLASSGLNARTCAEIANLARNGAITLGSANLATIKVLGQTGTLASPLCTLAGSTILGNGSARPCQGSAATRKPLEVHIQYAYTAPVPLVPPSRATLDATGSFQCEYS